MSGTIHNEALRFFEIPEHSHEMQFMRIFQQDFHITWARVEKNFNTQASAYLMKPLEHMANSFGFDRELLCIYSPYPELQPRTIQLSEHLLTSFISVRERAVPLLYVLISDDDQISEQIGKYLVDNRDARLVIPFSRSELQKVKGDSYFIRNRFRQYLYSRNLFDMQSPLNNEVFYFGRKDMTPELLDRFKTGQNTGIFGLRKTGKTSLLHAVERAIKKDNSGHSIYIDAEDTALHEQSWFGALHHILYEIYQSLSLEFEYEPKDFTSSTASRVFKDGLVKALSVLPESKRRILLIIDEIEHISFDTSRVERWNNDFLPFWQTMRSVHQSLKNSFVFLIAGVNARPVETASVKGIDNPLYLWVSPWYMPSFSVQEVRTMVRTLGRPMGMNFEEQAYNYLTRTYGGHPYLIRQACSWHHKMLKEQNRPIEITVDELKRYQSQRDNYLESFVEQIVQLLAPWYEFEYDMLKVLAGGDVSWFQELSEDEPAATKHLYNYGLITKTDDDLRFTISAVEHYFKKAPFAAEHNAKLNKTRNELDDTVELENFWAESSRLRNRMERKLRILIKNFLKSRYAKIWIDKVINNVHDPQGDRKEQLRRIDADEVLDQLYLLDLVNIIEKNWEAFQALEQYKLQKRKVSLLLEHVNDHRPDAHAKPITSSELATLRVIYEVFEKVFTEYDIR
ncbi:MAG: AAA-like domain-containing protein [Anaerolineae bacterium]|nr:AAA-like domain-containing protein [Anaerolineae bacterium]